MSSRHLRSTPRSLALAGLVIVIVLAAGVFAGACGGNDQSGGTAGTADTGTTSPFAGTWSLDGGGMTLDDGYSGYSIGSPGKGGFVTVKDAPGWTVTMTGSNGVTWEMANVALDGDYLTFTAGTEPAADKWAIRMSDGVATLTRWDTTAGAWADGYPLVKAP
jgi:hypothetical protein